MPQQSGHEICLNLQSGSFERFKILKASNPYCARVEGGVFPGQQHIREEVKIIGLGETISTAQSRGFFILLQG